MTSTQDEQLREALRRALMAAGNLLAELEASDAELEPEDQAVVHGAKEDMAFARTALASLPAPDTAGEVVAWRRAWNYHGMTLAVEFTDDANLAELWRGHPQTDSVAPLYAALQPPEQFAESAKCPQAPATGEERDDLRDAREVVARWRIGYGEAIRAGEAWQEMVEAVRMGIAFARDSATLTGGAEGEENGLRPIPL